MNRLLHISAIQLCGLLVGIPILLNILDLILSPSIDFSFYYVAPFITLVSIAVFFGWLWAVGSNLTKILPADSTLQLPKFKGALTITFLLLASTVLLQQIVQREGQLNDLLLVTILPQVLAIPFLLYSFYYIAKALKTCETNSEVTFSEFSGEFFMLLFFAIGVWFIQPRINKLFEEKQVLSV